VAADFVERHAKRNTRASSARQTERSGDRGGGIAALAGGSVGATQPVQQRNRTDNRQLIEELTDCDTGCTVAPISDETAFEERAAILEYDGGLSREEAEAQAVMLTDFPEMPPFLRRDAAVPRHLSRTLPARAELLPCCAGG
jgi:hypothetical protein